MKNKINYLLLILWIIIILVGYYSGYFRDEYPQIIIPSYIDALYICMNVAIPFTIAFMAFKPNNQKMTKVLLIFDILILATFIGMVIPKIYEAKTYYSRDYIKAEQINGVSLKSVEDYISDDSNCLIYIGRADCSECKSAEKLIGKALLKKNIVIPGYYTNLDRNNKSSNKMYKILDYMHVNHVPMLVYKDNENNFVEVEIEAQEIEKFADKLE